MDYKTYTPSSDLSSFIKCYWSLDGAPEAEPVKQRIIPDGCMEMIFHYGDLYKQYFSNGSSIIQPKCFVFGQITTLLEIEPTGVTGIFAVRFKPNGLTPLISMPLSEMENRAVSLSELFGENGTDLEKKVLKAKHNVDRIKIIESFLLGRLMTTEAVDRIAKESVEIITQLKGQLTVDELTEQIKINRRQLERKFSSAIGLSPKQLSKIIRLQATLKMLANNQFTSLTSLAHEGDYYDQAHFIKDFKEFTCISPKKFFAGNLKMSTLFIDAD